MTEEEANMAINRIVDAKPEQKVYDLDELPQAFLDIAGELAEARELVKKLKLQLHGVAILMGLEDEE